MKEKREEYRRRYIPYCPNENETWKPIPAFQNYFVSSFGRIMFNDGNLNRIRKTHRWGEDYYSVVLKIKGRQYIRRVHRLVLLAFAGHSPLHANHKNGNKIDNRIENLEYVTQKQNAEHAAKTGLILSGNNSKATKIKDEQLKQIILLHKNKKHTFNEIAKIFNVSRSTIKSIVMGTRKYPRKALRNYYETGVM